MINSSQKYWLSPFIAVTFFAIAITGMFMLFQIHSPVIHTVHKWGSLIFVIGCMVHLTLNWRIFISYFPKRKAISGALIGIFALVFIALVIPSGGHKDKIHADETSTSYSVDKSHRR